MKLLHLFFALALPVSAWATTRTVTLNPPAQVYAGQAFLMSASASTSATDSEQIGFFHGHFSYDNGATWHWFTNDMNAGKSATRNGWINTGVAYSTILVMVKVAFRGGAAGDVDYNGNPINWSGSWDGNQSPPAKFVTITVQPPPNQPPTVTWVQNPASAWINQWFPIQARGNDSNGNLSNLWVWREWVPHAFGPGGNGWEAYSDPNLASRSSAGTLTFQAQSADSSGATSPVIYHTVTVPNRDPSISIQILNESQSPITLNGNGRAPVPIGKPFYVRVNGSDPDARLARLYSRLNRPDGTPEAYPEQAVSGGSATHNFGPYTADATNEIGVWNVWGHVVDADAGGYQWQGNGWAGSDVPDVEVYNTSPHSLSLTPSGPTLQWNSTYGHYTMWTNNTLTVTSNLQDADGNLTGHTLRYQNVTGSGPVEANWIVVNGSAPSNTGNSTKQATLNLTPGRWDFNTFGGDWTFQLPGQSITVWVYGPENGAQFVSQSVPATMTTGDSFPVSITMRNSGNNPWTTDATPHRLGSQNPADTNRWGVTRVSLAAGETIVPTAQKTFTFNVTAPSTPGSHNFQWQMVEEGTQWFGAATTNLVINVTDNDPPSTPGGLASAGVTQTSFTLNWAAAADNAGVTLYEIERQGAGVVGTSAASSYNVTGLTASTTYQVRVRARDAAGNWSGWSGWLSVTTAFNPLADSDNDGMRNDWENQYFGSHTGGDPLADPDNDGFTNVAEYNLSQSPVSYNAGTSALGNSIPGGWPNGAGGPNHSANLAVGATAGELNVDKSGAATYSVPIWTTPGTAGMEPKISLSYSSQAGNGIAGFGWSIGGVSAITRGPKTIAVDGVARGVRFDAQDQFYLDGQRLILVAGTHGVAGAEYRTELETFTKVVANGSTGAGPASFTAWTKAGLIIQFGHSADAAFNPGGGSTVHSWHVNRISDTKGNYMDFVYDEVVNSTEGSHRLSRINYTGNGGVAPYASLRFEYEDRPDVVRGFSGGSPVSFLKRLKHLRSYFGETLARTYTLAYAQREFTGRSLLTSLTEAGSDGKAYPPLSFDYGIPSNGWEEPGNFAYEPTYPLGDNQTNSSYPTGTGFVDLNGDGRIDFVAKRDSASASVVDTFSINNGTGWDNEPSGYYYKLPYPLGYSDKSQDSGARFVDFDNDGLVDYVVYKVDSSGNLLTRRSWRNTGTGWTEVYGNYLLPAPSARDNSNAFLKPYQAENFGHRSGRFMDMNGDGLPDYVTFLTTTPGTNGGKTKIAVYLNNGNGWNQSPTASYSEAGLPGGAPPDLADFRAKFVDLNGDGLPDIVAALKNGSVQSYVCFNTGSGWEGAGSNWNLPTWISEYGKPRIGAEFLDLNGDGLLDLLWSRETPSIEGGYAFNTGAGWEVHTSAIEPFRSPVELGRENLSGSGAAFVDFNADGLPDLLMGRHLNNAGSTSVHLGSTTGWQPTSDSSWHLPDHLLIDNNQSDQSVGADFVDFDGDGVSDFVWKRWASTGAIQKGIRRNKANPLADRLQKVTNGFGVSARITYKTLLDGTVYTKGSGGSADTVNLTGPMYVVSSVSHDDGTLNGQGQPNQYALNYRYGGLRSHRLRGSLGFQFMTVTDSRTAIRTETTYAQTWPFTGMPISSQTISGSTVLKDSLVVYQEKLLNSGKTRFVFAQDSDEITRDLNGATLGSTSTTIPTPATDIDDYGNIKKLVVDTDGYTKTTDSVFTNDTGNWFLGRLTSSTVTTTASGQTTQVRTSSFTYEPTTGLLLTETVQPGDAVLGLTTTYGYDQFGNKTSVAVSGYNLNVDANGNYSAVGTVTRTTTTQYDGNGRFPLWTRNALTHQENYTGYDQVKGVLTSMTGANGLSTSWAYDGFGRKIQETRADGTVSNTHYRWVAGAPGQAKPYPGLALPTARYHVETESTGAPPSLAFHDAFGRAFLTLGVNGDGNIVYTTTHHDNMGRAFAASVPYLASGSAYWTRTTSFDLLNRPVTVVTPDDENGDQTTSYSYNGLTVQVTDPKGRVARTVKNSQGWTIENTRNATAVGGAPASTVTYGYDVLGNLTSTNAAGITTTLGYDIRGRKTSMTDADMGTWHYRYNVFGELIWQKDAKGQITTMVYDALGRLTSRTEAEGTTTWTYDTSPTRGIGKLHTVTAPAGLASSAYSETHLYDTLGRPVQVTRTIDSNSYTTQTAYDGAGRVLRTIYPAYTGSTSISTRHVYNAFGYLQEIRNWLDSDTAAGAVNRTIASPTGRLYWRADSYAVTGKINGETYGNGLAGDRVYSAVTGRLQRATIDRGSVITAPFFVQDLSYTYDAMGNVNSRIEATAGYARQEYFYTNTPGDGYDGLDRLLVHRVVGGATVTVSYDAKGNITHKSDVGSYTYSGYGPHAVSTAGVNTYTYDGVGNMLTGAGRTLEWTSFNQMRKVTQGNKISEFAFGAGHERVLQIRRTNGAVTDRTVYVGALYERVLSGGGQIEHKHYIMGPTGRIAVHTERSDFTKDTRWFHTDGLGSITVISDEAGRVLKRHTYDAWGKQATSYTNTGSGITNTAPSTRGFTDHEMLSDFGLIHMNGRVYDPSLGRFLSADPLVDDEEDAQGFNRYSYVGNNPLSFTDPTGHLKFWKEFLGPIFQQIATVVGYIFGGPVGAAFASAAVGATINGLNGAIQGFLSGFTFGFTGANWIAAQFVSGFSGSLLNGGSLGDAFRAGTIGATQAFFAQKIGGKFGHEYGDLVNEFGRAVAHGALGGAVEEATGGQFRHGFYAAFIGSAVGSFVGTGSLGDLEGWTGVTVRTVIVAVAGGTAAELGGGKFANGAVTASFQHLLNHEGNNLRQNLSEGYSARIDKFTTRGVASYEIHVYKGKTEVGVLGPGGWINKHGHSGIPKLPDGVRNRLNGIQISELRARGWLGIRGTGNIRGGNYPGGAQLFGRTLNSLGRLAGILGIFSTAQAYKEMMAYESARMQGWYLIEIPVVDVNEKHVGTRMIWYNMNEGI